MGSRERVNQATMLVEGNGGLAFMFTRKTGLNVRAPCCYLTLVPKTPGEIAYAQYLARRSGAKPLPARWKIIP